MRRTLIAGTILVAALSQQANAGFWGDAKRNLAGLGLPIEQEIPIEQPANIPVPTPLPVSPDPAVAYIQWLAPQLKSGMALYNRPCMVRTAYGARVVRCPVGIAAVDAPVAPIVTLPGVVAGAYPVDPSLETVPVVRRSYRYRHAHARRHVALERR